MEYDIAQAVAAQVYASARARALAIVARADAEMDDVYKVIAEGVRRDLKATGYTIEQVRAVIDKHLGESRDRRVDIVARGILDAAREGSPVAEDTFRAVFGEEAAAESARPFSRASRLDKTPSMRLVGKSEDESR